MRDSNLELLRIVAMVFIVVYHILHFYLIPYSDCAALKAACIPLHQGVILFVLISGFYGIQLSFRKIIKFIFPVAFYYVILSLFGFFINGGSIINCFLFISRSPYWFVRTYLWLLLTSPIINTFLRYSNPRLRIYMLCALGCISIWMGVTGGDLSIDGGKNLLNFYFMYCLGYEIKQRQNNFEYWHKKTLVFLYIAINLLVVFVFSAILDRFYLADVLYDWCFKYNSLFLIIDSCVLFVIFSKIKICSNFVNTIAASCFSIYLITEHDLIHKYIIQPIVSIYYEFTTDWLYLLGITIIFSILLSMMCVLNDSVLVSRIAKIVFSILRQHGFVKNNQLY